MPSPIAHSLMGYLIYRVTTKTFKWRKRYIVLLYIFLANIPDLDFIPGLFVGSASRYHHGISHSIGFALIFAFGCYVIQAILKQAYIKRSVVIVFCLYFSHIVLDYLTKAPTNLYGDPVGEKLLWPFSNLYYIAHFAFFPIIHFNGTSLEFLLSLLSMQNLIAMGVEFAILSPVIVAVELWKYRNKHYCLVDR